MEGKLSNQNAEIESFLTKLPKMEGFQSGLLRLENVLIFITRPPCRIASEIMTKFPFLFFLRNLSKIN